MRILALYRGSADTACVVKMYIVYYRVCLQNFISPLLHPQDCYCTPYVEVADIGYTGECILFTTRLCNQQDKQHTVVQNETHLTRGYCPNHPWHSIFKITLKLYKRKHFPNTSFVMYTLECIITCDTIQWNGVNHYVCHPSSPFHCCERLGTRSHRAGR